MLVVIESNVFILREAVAQAITYHDNPLQFTDQPNYWDGNLHLFLT